MNQQSTAYIPIEIPFLPLDRITALHQPQISKAVQRVVESGWYVNGAELHSFEQQFAAYVGTTHCIGVGNGLDALTLSLMAMKWEGGWEDGDEVIVPNMTFVATALAVVRAKLRPVFADVDDKALLTASTAEPHITQRTRCLLPVHLYGHAAPMNELLQLARTYGLMVLEDVAQAHGTISTDGRKAGSIGIMAAFSFYPGKNLGALGDAGCVCTNSERLASRVRMLANYGAKTKYEHVITGFNSRMDEIQAAVLCAKLATLDAENERRRSVAALYAKLIRHPEVKLPYDGNSDSCVFHIYAVRCARRDALQLHLRRQGIQTLVHYPHPLTSQRALAPYVTAESHFSCPKATCWAKEELSLPISPIISEEEVWKVAQAVNGFCS